MVESAGRRAVLVAVLVLGAIVPARATHAASCRSTCTEELRTCGTLCAGLRGEGRRACRRRCAEQSTCNAPGNRLRLGALVVNDCTTDAAGFTTFKQKLQVRRGNCDPVTIMELPAVGPLLDSLGLCRIYGDFRNGANSVGIGLFQRLAILPDASAIVFELTNRNSIVLAFSPAPPEEGIFIARPDGSGLRRLGPATGVPILKAVADPSSPIGLSFVNVSGTAFGVSPNSRLITFFDDVSGPTGEDPSQVFVQDLVSGARRQVTRLPLAPAGTPARCCPSFVDDRTVVFFDGPTGSDVRVKTDGTDLEVVSVEAIRGSRVLPQFGVVGGAATKVVGVLLPGVTPAKTYASSAPVKEVFILDGPRTLQLTNFRYPDTGSFAFGRKRVLITASANPLGKNPTENCQLFSIDTLGGGLRQLTSFRDEGHVNLGCGTGIPGAACAFSGGSQDRETGFLAFGSECDPFGRNPYGENYFSMRPDGSGLRQITSFRGRELFPDGSVHVELGGPVAQATVY